MTTVTIQVRVTDEAADRYLETSARLRGVARGVLLRRIIATILKDQLILSVLDDGDALNLHPASVPKSEGPRAMPPKDHVNTPPPAYHSRGRPRRYQPTKAEMQEDLHQAVLNTGGRRMSLAERRAAILAKIRSHGRVGWADLGFDGQVWIPAMKSLLADGTVVRCDPEPGTRRVYFVLRPTATGTADNPHAVAVPGLASPEVPSAGDTVISAGDIPKFLFGPDRSSDDQPVQVHSEDEFRQLYGTEVKV